MHLRWLSRRTLCLIVFGTFAFCLLLIYQLATQPCDSVLASFRNENLKGKGGHPNKTIEALSYLQQEFPGILDRFRMSGNSRPFYYDRQMPLVFIGGMPRSGTTLLRVILDAHPDVRCGEETRVIPRLLGMKQQWMTSPIESKRLAEAGITGEVLDNAISSFILEIIVRHGKIAKRLCNKDPFTLRSAVYLNTLFPNAKYILLLRDGRAVIHSIISRKVTITGFDLTSYRQCLTKWNSAMTAMWGQCRSLGESYCFPVHYEQLVLHPREHIKRILDFLELPWNDSVLHHDQLVGRPDGIALSDLERSSDQVIKPINIEALSKWVGHIPEDVVRDMAKIAPMLQTLGYDPAANPPDYGKPDSFVLHNTKHIQAHQHIWEAKEREFAKKREAFQKSRRKGSAGKHLDADTPN
ncbi:TPST2 [Cordylochernes scorpioides]|uniref:Protein-tyrosine sulfotransferase n=1 Tax=Cordylochernes scorpioides TaxID=51811 RepID=A0ABY6LMQ4_9ARAC|nr:TPST2 [Cordylochernes scorpioides]